MSINEIVEKFLNSLKSPGMTRNRLARESGISKTVVYDLADGARKRVSMKNLEKMQEYLGGTRKSNRASPPEPCV